MQTFASSSALNNIIKGLILRAKSDYIQATNYFLQVLYNQIKKVQEWFILNPDYLQNSSSLLNLFEGSNENRLNQNQVLQKDPSFYNNIQEQLRILIQVHKYNPSSGLRLINYFLQHKIHQAIINPIQKTCALIQKQMEKLSYKIQPYYKKFKFQPRDKKYVGQPQNQLNKLQTQGPLANLYFQPLFDQKTFKQEFQTFLKEETSYMFKNNSLIKSQNVQIVQNLVIQSSRNNKIYPASEPHYIVFEQLLNVNKNQFTFKNQSDGFSLNQNQGQQLVFGLIDPITFKNYKNPLLPQRYPQQIETRNTDRLMLKMICFNKEYYIKNQLLAKAIIYQPSWRRFNIKVINKNFILSGVQIKIFAYTSETGLKQNSQKNYIKTQMQKEKMLKQGRKLYQQKVNRTIVEIPLPPCLQDRVLKPFIWFKGFHLKVQAFKP